MNCIKKTWCRIYQFAFKLAHPFLPYRKPEILSSVDQIPLKLKELSADTVLLVTDRFLYESGICNNLTNAFKTANITYHIYSDTCANPTFQNVREAYELYTKNKCKAIIAFGGGSPMDCAKAVGACAAHPRRKLKNLVGLLRIFRSLPPIFAIPTTAGTGSEVTPTSVITDEKACHKYTMNSFPLIPHYAVHDGAVTFSLPKHLTATTGIDALTHAVEAYIGINSTKETRALSLEASKLIIDNIITAYNEPANLKARENMLSASYKAGIAFSKAFVGYIHAVAHSLGGKYNIPHGLANSVTMPHVLKMYGSTIHKKLWELAVYTEIADKDDSYDIGANKFIQEIERLNAYMNIPETLSGIHADDIPLMAKYADKEANPLYPVPMLMNAKELEKIYHIVAGKELVK